MITTWVTFVPCFLWIFVSAPFIERLRGNAALSGALSAITAAVVGVILNLAIWFALHVLLDTVVETGILGLTLDVPVLSSELGRDRADGGGYAGDIQVRRIDGLGAGRLRTGGSWSHIDLMVRPAAFAGLWECRLRPDRNLNRTVSTRPDLAFSSASDG